MTTVPKKHSTSFYTTPTIRRQLDDLCQHYGEKTSEVITRLITEAHANRGRFAMDMVLKNGVRIQVPPGVALNLNDVASGSGSSMAFGSGGGGGSSKDYKGGADGAPNGGIMFEVSMEGGGGDGVA